MAALLYYFGYVTTLARYSYFGLDLAQLRFTTQELALQSVAAVYVPVAILLGAGLLAYLARRWVKAMTLGRPRRSVVLGAVGLVLGTLLVARAITGILVPAIAETEPIATTPACLGAGAVLAAFGADLVVERRPTGSEDARRRRVVWTFVAGAVVLSLFWAANSFAAAYGAGQAEIVAERMGTRPRLVLDTKERLYLDYGGIEETSLPAGADQTFRYRYRGLRLLVESGERMFLVPAVWVPGTSRVLVLPDDGSVRVQLGT
ncbi:hypothetical protein GCM10009836_32530 [Pseudonocardia ailaonensis]|uniref:DUF5671 domain-containing protein n=1 Tax=Pseudonocardia ailaonensis TaxID=367279 RepID=A0ABN2N445_9PSEU